MLGNYIGSDFDIVDDDERDDDDDNDNDDDNKRDNDDDENDNDDDDSYYSWDTYRKNDDEEKRWWQISKNTDKKLTMTKTMRMMTTINNCNDEINGGDKNDSWLK